MEESKLENKESQEMEESEEEKKEVSSFEKIFVASTNTFPTAGPISSPHRSSGRHTK